MFSYTVTFSHPTLDADDLRAFLEHEFSLWDLMVTRSDPSDATSDANDDGDDGKAGSDRAPAFQVTFQHPWLEPATMFNFLEREYTPSDLSVSRDGQAALSFTGSRGTDEEPRKRGLARKTELLGRAILELFESPEVEDAERLATVTGPRAKTSVANVLRLLVAEGRIRRLRPGRFIAADQPDPEPAPSPAKAARTLPRRARPAADTPSQMEAAILKHLEEAPAATLASLGPVAGGRAKPTIHEALRRLLEQGKIPREGHGIYILTGKPDPTPEQVAELKSRRGKVNPAAPVPKLGSRGGSGAQVAEEIMAIMAKDPAVTAVSLEAVLEGRSRRTISQAFLALLAEGRIRCEEEGVYVKKGKRAPSEEFVRELKSRKPRAGEVESADEEDSDAADALLNFLADPRSLEEVRAHLASSPTTAARRMGEMVGAGEVHRRRVGLRHLYGTDSARLDAVADGKANDLKPAKWKVLQVMPLAGRLRLSPVAEAAGVSSGHLLATARQMHRRGLIDMRQEGRGWLVSLTEAGVEAADLEEGKGEDLRLVPEQDLLGTAGTGDLDAA